MSHTVMKPGQKYGLQIKAKPAPAAAPKAPPKNLFGLDDDEPNSVNETLKWEQAKKQKKMEQQRQAALAQDASVFAYDEVFEDLQSKKHKEEQAIETKKQDRTARYLPNLLEKAKFRERERDIIYNKGLLKEREKEDHMFEDKEKFVTSAYKQKLLEDKAWAAELARKDAKDAALAAEKKGSMSSFYSNLLESKTGGSAKSEPPAPDTAKPNDSAESSPPAPAKRGPIGPFLPPAASSNDTSSAEASHQRSASAEPREPRGAQAAPHTTASTLGPSSRPSDIEAEADRAAARAAREAREEYERKEMERIKEKQAAQAKIRQEREAELAKRRNDETAVMSAKERYLARKKAKTAADQSASNGAAEEH